MYVKKMCVRTEGTKRERERESRISQYMYVFKTILKKKIRKMYL